MPLGRGLTRAYDWPCGCLGVDLSTGPGGFVAGRRFPGLEHAEHEALAWIGFYNAERLHEELGDIPPAEFEAMLLDDQLPGREAPAEAGRPALSGGAPSGLGQTTIPDPVSAS